METKKLRIFVAKMLPVIQILSKSRYFMIGLVIVLPIVVLGSLGPLFIPYEKAYMGLYTPRTPPSLEHILGTDVLGRDVFAVLVHSLSSSLQIGLIAGFIDIIIGVFIGFLAGYKGGLIGSFLMDITNIFLIVPTWPLLVVISTMVRVVTIPMVAIILAAFSWPWGARLYRSQVLSLKERPFVELAKLSGMSDLEIIFREVLPNVLSWISVIFVGAVTWAMINEVSLEVIGLGPQGVTTIGIMLFWAIQWGSLFRGLWWCLFSPVFVLAGLFIGLQLIIIGMDQILNPRLRE
jgi:peptide/nickel transport system permease protein